jgi:hypothetical protein
MRRRAAHFCLIFTLGAPLLCEERCAADGTHPAPGVIESAEQDETESFDGLSLIALPTSPDAGPIVGLDPLRGLDAPILIAPTRVSLPVRSPVGWGRRGLPPWPPPSAERRYAWLQVFLF